MTVGVSHRIFKTPCQVKIIKPFTRSAVSMSVLKKVDQSEDSVAGASIVSFCIQ